MSGSKTIRLLHAAAETLRGEWRMGTSKADLAARGDKNAEFFTSGPQKCTRLSSNPSMLYVVLCCSGYRSLFLFPRVVQ